ncbi:glyoxylase I family protein [Actinokineospora baliensis]|uniref:VOC family protein n=1 Tax=Actinokineospora baliensis TaxID=547056 RepID=UPI00195A3A18|nr:VOC family protein [Actinokineospora baliensis]MBM7770829.1 glyoxylase I family protein [Actinokineospora baliensis]
MPGVEHIALTVTDVDRSVPWYERVLGFTTESRTDRADGPSTVRLRGLGVTLTLVQYPDGSHAPFDECRPGLDHLVFSVADRTWPDRLAEYGVPHTDTPDGVALRDPDGIRLVLAVTP